VSTPVDGAPIRRPEDVTAAWLTSVLTGSGRLAAGEEVASFTSSPVGTGQMADTVRISFATTGAGAPGSVVAKFASEDGQSRSTGLMTQAYEVEVGFYSEVAGRVRTRIPACHHASFEPEAGWFVIVLDDVVDGVQGDQLRGCDVDEAEAALVELAGLHGPTWSSGADGGSRWLERGGPAADRFLVDVVTPLWPGFVERYGDLLDDAHLDLCGRFIGRLGPWLSDRPAPVTVVHGDFRLDNLLFCPGERRPVVVDWQTASRGSAASDVAYFVGGSLTTDDRRRHHDRLVRTYHDALVDQGVTGFPLGRLEEEIRSLCFGGLLMSIGASMLVKRTDRGDEMFVTSVRRYAQQALDLDAEATLPADA
jgi:hypothetical protein